MATITHRVTTPDTGNLANASGAFTPAVGDLLVVFATIEASTADHTLTGTGGANLTYAQIRKQLFRTSADALFLYVATSLVASATSSTVSLPSPGSGSIISVYSVSGMDKIGTAAVRGQGGQDNKAAGAPAPSASFAQAALTANPILVALANATNPAGMTPPANTTESQDTGYATGAVTGLETALANSGVTATTITWASNSASISANIIAELDASKERATAIGATGAIVAVGLLIAPRAVALDATGAITTAGEVVPGVQTHERSVTLDGVGAIASSGSPVKERSAAIDASGAITSAGIVLRLIERAAVLDATGVLTSAGQRDVLRAAAIAASGEITSAGSRDVLRSAAFNAAVALVSAPQRDLQRTTALSASGAITSSGEIVPVGPQTYERSASLNATGAIASDGFAVAERPAALSATATIASSGAVESGVTTHSRSVLIEAACVLSSTGQQHDVLRSASVNAAGAIESAPQRELQRSATIDAVVTITATWTPPPPGRWPLTPEARWSEDSDDRWLVTAEERW